MIDTKHIMTMPKFNPHTPHKPDTKSSFPVFENKTTFDGQTIVYVCENNICKFPTEDLSKALQLLRENKKYSLNLIEELISNFLLATVVSIIALRS